VSPSFGFTLAFTPDAGSETNSGVKAGDTFRGTITVTPLNGYTGTVNLSCSQQPQCTISPASVVAGPGVATATLAVTTGVNDLGDQQLTINGVDKNDSFLQASTNVIYTILNYNLSTNPGAAQVTAGQTASYKIVATINAASGAPAFPAVSLACSGLPALATCLFSPTSVTFGTNTVSATFSIATTAARTVTTTASLSAPRKGAGVSTYRLFAFLPVVIGLAGLAASGRTSRRRKLLGCLLVLGLLGVLVSTFGCRGMVASTVPSTTTTTRTTTTPGTPAGTYTVTVTGTAGQIQHSTNVNLTVN
jgi:hypothetical protein